MARADSAVRASLRSQSEGTRTCVRRAALPRRSFCNLMTLQAISMHREHAVDPFSVSFHAWSAHTLQAASRQQGPAAAHPQATWPRCVSTRSTVSPLCVSTRSLSCAAACKKVAWPCCCPSFDCVVTLPALTGVQLRTTSVVTRLSGNHHVAQTGTARRPGARTA